VPEVFMVRPADEYGDIGYQKRNKTYPEGRRCKVCGSVLSTLNKEPTCFRHTGPKRRRRRTDNEVEEP